MQQSFQHVRVCAVTLTVPATFIDIDDELAFFDHNPKKLARAKKIIGFGRRHIVPQGVTAQDLCFDAAKRLIEKTSTNPSSIDTLLLVNQSPDYLHPQGACILQHKLGLSKECVAFDLPMGCAGYVYGLYMAHCLITAGSKRVLLLAGDTPSTHSRLENRRVNPLFGDAGSATLLEWVDDEQKAFFDLGCDGSGWQNLAIPAGGARLPITHEILEDTITDNAGNPWNLTEALIVGHPVYEFSIQTVPRSIQNVLHLSGKTISDIDFIALHQANRQILAEIAARLNLKPEKIPSHTFSHFGNQSTASVVGVICHELAHKMINRELDILLCGFGVGYSWASAILHFKNCHNLGISFLQTQTEQINREELIEFWKKSFLGENF